MDLGIEHQQLGTSHMKEENQMIYASDGRKKYYYKVVLLNLYSQKTKQNNMKPSSPQMNLNLIKPLDATVSLQK